MRKLNKRRGAELNPSSEYDKIKDTKRRPQSLLELKKLAGLPFVEAEIISRCKQLAIIFVIDKGSRTNFPPCQPPRKSNARAGRYRHICLTLGQSTPLWSGYFHVGHDYKKRDVGM
jgi:hypothetical protein